MAVVVVDYIGGVIGPGLPSQTLLTTIAVVVLFDGGHGGVVREVGAVTPHQLPVQLSVLLGVGEGGVRQTYPVIIPGGVGVG